MLATLLMAALAIGGYAGWRWWQDPSRVLFRDTGSELEQLREGRRRLTRELRTAREEIAELRGRSTFEARSCEIDVQACAAVRDTVAGLEAEAAELREQLAFYRNIVSPEQARAGVRVMSIALRPRSSEGAWRYDLVLVQPMRRDRIASGSYDLRLEGLLDQQVKVLGLDALRDGNAAPASFSFRSFQEFSGELRLPSGFLPSRLTVTLQVQDGKNAPVEVSESFDWSRVAVAQE